MPAKSPANLLIRALILFVALFALLIGYYWVHKPFDLLVFKSVGGALLDLLTVGALFGIAGGLGRAALARNDLSAINRAERIALECGLGIGIIALGALIFGLIGLFRPLLLWAVLIVVTVILRKSLLAWLRDCLSLLRSIRVESPGRAAAMLYCVFMLGLALLIALAPPTHWDSLTYHLIAAERYIRLGAITAQPDNFYLGLSQNVEMLYGLTFGLFGRVTAAAPVHFGLGIIALLATAGVTRRYAGRSAGWVAALLLLSSYNLWALFGWAYVDLGTLMFGALALIAATAWREARTRGWLVLIGVIVGLAMGVKYTTAALGIALGLFVLLHEPRRAIQNGAIILVAALIAFAPWMIKGLLLYHNPIYPFVFNGLNWNAERSTEFSFSAYNLIAKGEGWQLPVLPVAATIFGRDNADGFGFTLGPWLLTLFLLLPLVWTFLESRARQLARDALTLLLPLVIFWAIMAALNAVGIQTRLMVMALPAFAASGAVALHGLAQFPKKPLAINFIMRAVLALTLLLTVLDAFWDTSYEQVVPYLLAQEDLNTYMYTNTQAYYNAMINLPAGSRVLMMWEPRGFYCPPTVTCTADVLFDHWKLPLLDGLSPDQVFDAYHADYDYLLLSHALYDEYLAFSPHRDLDEQLPAALDQRMTPVWTDGIRYTLYGWKQN
ncbi:MAG: hypothetical protein GC204_03875 [Chloroflexi bacterium]|nr:hypothetical protein [Chloroflexota bacterium]